MSPDPHRFDCDKDGEGCHGSVPSRKVAKEVAETVEHYVCTALQITRHAAHALIRSDDPKELRYPEVLYATLKSTTCRRWAASTSSSRLRRATPNFVDHVTLAIDWFHCQSGLPRRMSAYRLTDLAELVKQYMGS